MDRLRALRARLISRRRVRTILLGAMSLSLLTLGMFATAAPVAASGNCAIAYIWFSDGAGSSHRYCYGNNGTYGDTDMSSETGGVGGAHNVMGPLDYGGYADDFDTANGTSGINVISWWQRTDAEFRFCAWNLTGQPNGSTIWMNNSRTGNATPFLGYEISSFKIISSTYTCNSHP